MIKKLFPLEHTIGFMASIVLTLLTASTLYSGMNYSFIITILVVAAFMQAALQVLLFMHVRENEDRNSLYVTILYGVFIALVIVFGSIWIMVYGFNHFM